MSDPYRPGRSGWEGPESEPPTYQYPQYPDPAYAGQAPTYGSGQAPPYGSGYGSSSPGEPPATGSEPPPPEPPKSPKWLWLLAGAAVLLVVGLVVALVIANGSSDKPAGGPTVSAPPSSKAGTSTSRPPSTTKRPGTTAAPPSAGESPTQSSEPGVQQTVAYSVTGTGRAISIMYTEGDGVVQTVFNVPLPWDKEVTLDSSTPATLTVANLGEEVTCTLTVDGEQVAQRTGSILTVCASSG